MLTVLANIYGALVMNVIFRMDYSSVQLSQPSRRQAAYSGPAGLGPPSLYQPPTPLTIQCGESLCLLQSLLKYHLFRGDFATRALKFQQIPPWPVRLSWLERHPLHRNDAGSSPC